MPRRLTKRQKQSRRISRTRAKKKRIRTLLRRGAVLCFGAAALAVLATTMGWEGMQRLRDLPEQGTAEWRARTASLGFTLRHVYLDGRRKTPLPEIREALQLEIGMPIFAVSAEEVRQRLEKIDRVAHASVERVLPDTLHVHIIERSPVAIWQNGGTLRLIDETGAVMRNARIGKHASLPIVVGEDAPAYLPALLTMLATEPELARHVKAAVRVGERRWNLKLAHGIEIKLPEKDAEAAWRRLARTVRQDKLFDRDVRAVDLRLEDRVFIRLSPGLRISPAPSAGET